MHPGLPRRGSSSPRPSAASSTRPTATSSSSSWTTRARTTPAASRAPSATAGSGSRPTPTTLPAAGELARGGAPVPRPADQAGVRRRPAAPALPGVPGRARWRPTPGLAVVAARRHMIDERSRVLVPRRGLSGLTGVRSSVEVARHVVRNGANPIGEPGGVLFRREHYFAVGGWRPERRFVMDLDLWIRLLQHGRVPRPARDPRGVPHRPGEPVGRQRGDDLRRAEGLHRGARRHPAPAGPQDRTWLLGRMRAPLGRMRRRTLFRMSRRAARRDERLAHGPSPRRASGPVVRRVAHLLQLTRMRA